MDTGFGYGDGLLLHGLVDSYLILDVHLIKLINTADTMISKHQCSSLYAELPRLRVLEYTRSKTSST